MYYEVLIVRATECAVLTLTFSGKTGVAPKPTADVNSEAKSVRINVRYALCVRVLHIWPLCTPGEIQLIQRPC